MVGRFWEAHSTVMSCDRVQGYLAPPLHWWGIVWAALRHMTCLRIFRLFFFKYNRIWVTLCTETVFLVLLLSMQEVPLLKYIGRTHNSPLAAYSSLFWLRPCPERDWAGFVHLPLLFFPSFFWGGRGGEEVFRLYYPSPAILRLRVESAPNLIIDPWTLISFIVLARVPPHTPHISRGKPPSKHLLHMFPWRAFAPAPPEPTLYHPLGLPCQEDQTATLLNLVLEIQLAAQLGVSSVCALRPSLICSKILFVACQFHTRPEWILVVPVCISLSHLLLSPTGTLPRSPPLIFMSYVYLWPTEFT